MPLVTYLGMLMMGLAGGLHCAAMCGGFAAAAAQSDWQPIRLMGRTGVAAGVVWQHVGRLASYSALGAAFAGMAATGGLAPAWLPLQLIMFIVANLLLIGFGLGLMGREVGTHRIEALGLRLHQGVQRLLAGLPLRGAGRQVALGMIWGLVPCGLIYAALAAAALAADPVQGALLLLAFGIGTLPNLLAAQWVIRQSRRFPWPRLVRIAMASVLIGFGVVGLARAAGLEDPARLLALCFPGIH